MKPPPDRLLDIHGSGADLPAPARPHYGVRWPPVLMVATGLGLLSTLLAWEFTRLAGRQDTPLQSLFILNFAWWYLWALIAPAVVWLSQHFRFERGGLLRATAVHVPAVIACSWLHIAAMEGVQWWLKYSAGLGYAWWAEVQRAAVLYLDWEMMTYWAIVGVSHALLITASRAPGPSAPRTSRPSSSRRASARCSTSSSRTFSSTRCTPSPR